MSTDAIIPVGKDCDCGHPLVWRNGRQICAVYGRHPDADEIASWGDSEARLIHYRNRNAPGADLIALSLNTVNNAPGAVRNRMRRQSYAQQSVLRAQTNSHGCSPSAPQPVDRTIAS